MTAIEGIATPAMLADSWHSYPSIFALGHKAIKELLDGPVVVEEKIDGSQFSFGVDWQGVLRVRSKGAIINADAPDKMFAEGVQSVRELAPHLKPGWTYRAEYLRSPKHNTLSYGRIPVKHIIIFDINSGCEEYLQYREKCEEAGRLGLEVAPRLLEGIVSDPNQFRALLEMESVLGGVKIEGVVVKPQSYNLFGLDHKALMGKFVNEAFKEAHGVEWKKGNPAQGDILAVVVGRYCPPARWVKSVQHLAEGGKLEGSVRDIGLLVREVPEDVEKECKEEMLEALWGWAWPQMRRMCVRGLAEWYKERLLGEQFSKKEEERHE